MLIDLLAVSVFWKTLPVVVIVLGVCWWVIWKFKLPFVSGIFWKTLAVVAVVVALIWTLALKLTEYEIMPADYGGTIISSLIFSYLIHLWIMPIDDSMLECEGDRESPVAQSDSEDSAD